MTKRIFTCLMVALLIPAVALGGGSLFKSKHKTRNVDGVHSIGIHICEGLQCNPVRIVEGDCTQEHTSQQWGVCLCDIGYVADGDRCVIQPEYREVEDRVVAESCENIAHASMYKDVCVCDAGYMAQDGRCVEITGLPEDLSDFISEMEKVYAMTKDYEYPQPISSKMSEGISLVKDVQRYAVRVHELVRDAPTTMDEKYMGYVSDLREIYNSYSKEDFCKKFNRYFASINYPKPQVMAYGTMQGLLGVRYAYAATSEEFCNSISTCTQMLLLDWEDCFVAGWESMDKCCAYYGGAWKGEGDQECLCPPDRYIEWDVSDDGHPWCCRHAVSAGATSCDECPDADDGAELGTDGVTCCKDGHPYIESTTEGQRGSYSADIDPNVCPCPKDDSGNPGNNENGTCCSSNNAAWSKSSKTYGSSADLENCGCPKDGDATPEVTTKNGEKYCCGKNSTISTGGGYDSDTGRKCGCASNETGAKSGSDAEHTRCCDSDKKYIIDGVSQGFNIEECGCPYENQGAAMHEGTCCKNFAPWNESINNYESTPNYDVCGCDTSKGTEQNGKCCTNDLNGELLAGGTDYACGCPEETDTPKTATVSGKTQYFCCDAGNVLRGNFTWVNSIAICGCPGDGTFAHNSTKICCDSNGNIFNTTSGEYQEFKPGTDDQEGTCNCPDNGTPTEINGVWQCCGTGDNKGKIYVKGEGYSKEEANCACPTGYDTEVHKKDEKAHREEGEPIDGTCCGANGRAWDGSDYNTPHITDDDNFCGCPDKDQGAAKPEGKDTCCLNYVPWDGSGYNGSANYYKCGCDTSKAEEKDGYCCATSDADKGKILGGNADYTHCGCPTGTSNTLDGKKLGNDGKGNIICCYTSDDKKGVRVTEQSEGKSELCGACPEGSSPKKDDDGKVIEDDDGKVCCSDSEQGVRKFWNDPTTMKTDKCGCPDGGDIPEGKSDCCLEFRLWDEEKGKYSDDVDYDKCECPKDGTGNAGRLEEKESNFECCSNENNRIYVSSEGYTKANLDICGCPDGGDFPKDSKGKVTDSTICCRDNLAYNNNPLAPDYTIYKPEKCECPPGGDYPKDSSGKDITTVCCSPKDADGNSYAYNSSTHAYDLSSTVCGCPNKQMWYCPGHEDLCLAGYDCYELPANDPACLGENPPLQCCGCPSGYRNVPGDGGIVCCKEDAPVAYRPQADGGDVFSSICCGALNFDENWNEIGGYTFFSNTDVCCQDATGYAWKSGTDWSRYAPQYCCPDGGEKKNGTCCKDSLEFGPDLDYDDKYRLVNISTCGCPTDSKKEKEPNYTFKEKNDVCCVATRAYTPRGTGSGDVIELIQNDTYQKATNNDGSESTPDIENCDCPSAFAGWDNFGTPWNYHVDKNDEGVCCWYGVEYSESAGGYSGQQSEKCCWNGMKVDGVCCAQYAMLSTGFALKDGTYSDDTHFDVCGCPCAEAGYIKDSFIPVCTKAGIGHTSNGKTVCCYNQHSYEGGVNGGYTGWDPENCDCPQGGHPKNNGKTDAENKKICCDNGKECTENGCNENFTTCNCPETGNPPVNGVCCNANQLKWSNGAYQGEDPDNCNCPFKGEKKDGNCCLGGKKGNGSGLDLSKANAAQYYSECKPDVCGCPNDKNGNKIQMNENSECCAMDGDTPMMLDDNTCTYVEATESSSCFKCPKDKDEHKHETTGKVICCDKNPKKYGKFNDAGDTGICCTNDSDKYVDGECCTEGEQYTDNGTLKCCKSDSGNIVTVDGVQVCCSSTAGKNSKQEWEVKCCPEGKRNLIGEGDNKICCENKTDKNIDGNCCKSDKVTTDGKHCCGENEKPATAAGSSNCCSEDKKKECTDKGDGWSWKEEDCTCECNGTKYTDSSGKEQCCDGTVFMTVNNTQDCCSSGKSIQPIQTVGNTTYRGKDECCENGKKPYLTESGTALECCNPDLVIIVNSDYHCCPEGSQIVTVDGKQSCKCPNNKYPVDGPNGTKGCCTNSTEFYIDEKHCCPRIDDVIVDDKCCEYSNMKEDGDKKYCCPGSKENYEIVDDKCCDKNNMKEDGDKKYCCPGSKENYEIVDGQCCDKNKVKEDGNTKKCCPNSTDKLIDGECCSASNLYDNDSKCCKSPDVLQTKDDNSKVCCSGTQEGKDVSGNADEKCCPNSTDKLIDGECCSASNLYDNDSKCCKSPDVLKTKDDNSKVCCSGTQEGKDVSGNADEKCCPSEKPELVSDGTCCKSDNVAKDDDSDNKVCCTSSEDYSNELCCKKNGGFWRNGECCAEPSDYSNGTKSGITMTGDTKQACCSDDDYSSTCCELNSDSHPAGKWVTDTCCDTDMDGTDYQGKENITCCPTERQYSDGNEVKCCDADHIYQSAGKNKCCSKDLVLMNGITKTCCSDLIEGQNEEGVYTEACCPTTKPKLTGVPADDYRICCAEDKLTSDNLKCCKDDETPVGTECCADENVATDIDDIKVCCGEGEHKVQYQYVDGKLYEKCCPSNPDQYADKYGTCCEEAKLADISGTGDSLLCCSSDEVVVKGTDGIEVCCPTDNNGVAFPQGKGVAQAICCKTTEQVVKYTNSDNEEDEKCCEIQNNSEMGAVSDGTCCIKDWIYEPNDFSGESTRCCGKEPTKDADGNKVCCGNNNDGKDADGSFNEACCPTEKPVLAGDVCCASDMVLTAGDIPECCPEGSLPNANKTSCCKDHMAYFFSTGDYAVSAVLCGCPSGMTETDMPEGTDPSKICCIDNEEGHYIDVNGYHHCADECCPDSKVIVWTTESEDCSCCDSDKVLELSDDDSICCTNGFYGSKECCEATADGHTTGTWVEKDGHGYCCSTDMNGTLYDGSTVEVACCGPDSEEGICCTSKTGEGGSYVYCDEDGNCA